MAEQHKPSVRQAVTDLAWALARAGAELTAIDIRDAGARHKHGSVIPKFYALSESAPSWYRPPYVQVNVDTDSTIEVGEWLL